MDTMWWWPISKLLKFSFLKYILVHIGTYWYILVHTGIYWYILQKNSKLYLIMCSPPSCTYESVQIAWLGPPFQFSSWQQSPPQSDHQGVACNCQSSTATCWPHTHCWHARHLKLQCLYKPWGTVNPVLAKLVWDCRSWVASQKQGDEGDSAYHVVSWSHVLARKGMGLGQAHTVWTRQLPPSAHAWASPAPQTCWKRPGWTRDHQVL